MELIADCKRGSSIKQVITIEYHKLLHSSIEHHFNSTTKSSLSNIQIPIDNEDWNNNPKD